MPPNYGRPVYLAGILEQLITPTHDQFMMAAGACLYPKTIHHILMRKPVAQVTLDKVALALSRGVLAPKPEPLPNSSDLSDRVHRCAIRLGGTVAAAAFLKITPLVVAKLIWGRPVNRRFRSLVIRRLEHEQEWAIGESVPVPVSSDRSSHDGLAQCIRAYELYKYYGTLEAVGRHLDLSRERVRQLINRGVAYGVIPAYPHYTEASHPFPFSTREEFLAAYRKMPSLRRLVQRLHVSKNRLKRFFRAHHVKSEDLTTIRHEIRRGEHKLDPATDIVVNM